MEAEYNALIKNDTWALVPYKPDMNLVQNKWIFKIKLKVDGSLDRFKARLVAKGFQQHAGIDYMDTFSPVVKASTIRVIFTLAISYNWSIQHVDVNNAFLNDTLQEQVFMEQPRGFESSEFPNHVCLLKKALYGLKQAPRAWYDQLRTVLLSWGFKNSQADSSLFYHHQDSQPLFILVYVDDIVITWS